MKGGNEYILAITYFRTATCTKQTQTLTKSSCGVSVYEQNEYTLPDTKKRNPWEGCV